ncbi:fido domain-containing protein [Coprinopsis sp. MPI-PUGE-AT-0042]|nr:fido domain-containing protein [Coprinopsis sp. MPI-PUGE-AT-0042]
MRTAAFWGEGYSNPGLTRTQTKKTVTIVPVYNIEYCPYDQVDEQLDVFCEIAKKWIKDEKWHNPFAIASWLHMSLAACHPFDDGNGRVARIVASIPLLAAGYPPFSLTLARRREYYTAIQRAHLEQEHESTVRSIMEGMKETLNDVEWILGAPVRR